MTSKAAISATQIEQRRQELKRQRRIEFWQAVWRSLFLTSLSGLVCWGIALPKWAIRQESQIKIKGNQFLSAEAIRGQLPLYYPQSLWQLPPQKLIQQLKSTTPIEGATITRQLLPPSLTVEVKERPPVAIALSPQVSLESSGIYSKEVGFLDERGTWMSRSSYASDRRGFEIPTLKVTGSQKNYVPYWREVYQLIGQSTVAISELDWQDPNNLILKTELGKVYLGADTSKFSEQLSVLSRMRELPNQIEVSQIAYIDLINPQYPKIKLQKERAKI